MSQRHTLFVPLGAAIALATLLGGAAPALAQTATPPTLAVTDKALPQVEAEVRKIDPRAGKITLKHGDIPNLDMPAMTMVFQLRDIAQAASLKVGDRVRFRTDKVNGAYTVIDIEPLP